MIKCNIKVLTIEQGWTDALNDTESDHTPKSSHEGSSECSVTSEAETGTVWLSSLLLSGLARAKCPARAEILQALRDKAHETESSVQLIAVEGYAVDP